MKKLSVLITILLVLFSFSLANAFKVVLKNDNEQDLRYKLTWITCPWENFDDGIADMSGGNLQIGEEFSLTRDYDPGSYIISWYDQMKNLYNEYPFRVARQNGILIITPQKTTFCPGI